MSREDQMVTLKTGMDVPILRDEGGHEPDSAMCNPVCACPKGKPAKLSL